MPAVVLGENRTERRDFVLTNQFHGALIFYEALQLCSILTQMLWIALGCLQEL